jgi:hypothetical protein
MRAHVFLRFGIRHGQNGEISWVNDLSLPYPPHLADGLCTDDQFIARPAQERKWKETVAQLYNDLA